MSMCFVQSCAHQSTTPTSVFMNAAGATAGLRGGAKFSLLSAPKFALRSLAQSLAREFQPKVCSLWRFNCDCSRNSCMMSFNAVKLCSGLQMHVWVIAMSPTIAYFDIAAQKQSIYLCGYQITSVPGQAVMHPVMHPVMYKAFVQSTP